MSSSCNITVYTLVSSIKSSQNAVTLKQGESQILSCMISPVNASNKQIEWKSSDEKIARVSTNGDGTAIVEAIAYDCRYRDYDRWNIFVCQLHCYETTSGVQESEMNMICIYGRTGGIVECCV